MVNKIILLISVVFLAVACEGGAKIDFTDPKIEKLGEGTLAEGITDSPAMMSGTLVRSSQNDGTDKIITGGKTYRIGKYSSASTYSFIQKRPLGSSTDVKIKTQGGVTKETGHAPDTSIPVEALTIVILTN